MRSRTDAEVHNQMSQPEQCDPVLPVTKQRLTADIPAVWRNQHTGDALVTSDVAGNFFPGIGIEPDDHQLQHARLPNPRQRLAAGGRHIAILEAPIRTWGGWRDRSNPKPKGAVLQNLDEGRALTERRPDLSGRRGGYRSQAGAVTYRPELLDDPPPPAADPGCMPGELGPAVTPLPVVAPLWLDMLPCWFPPVVVVPEEPPPVVPAAAVPPDAEEPPAERSAPD
jgi:hypothetical protein